MKTPKGGVVFANPTFSIVKKPEDMSRQVLVVALFVPSENGIDPAGTFVYYKDIGRSLATVKGIILVG